MDSRRNFLKKAALLAAGGSFWGALPASIQKAYAIDPTPGSTYLDAEHIVILMQENRSFDHTYGKLRGVRGFNDPRAMTLPDGNPVWLQTNGAGETYAPFRMNIKDTKATWMGSLPHGRESQLGASNEGRHDNWLDAKHSGEAEYRHLPLTMGFYQRDDLPFYYALADAFTICDQNFCSSLTATEPNRLHLWTGAVRANASIESFAYVRNEDMGYEDNLQLKWTTFPERLEAAGVSWKIYQNEISLPSGLTDDEDNWLSNFDDNPIEYFTQFRVRFSRAHRLYLAQAEKTLAAELEKLAAQTQRSEVVEKQTADKRAELEKNRHEQTLWSEEAFAKLSTTAQNLNRKAFTVNESDPDYRKLTTLDYLDGDTKHQMPVPRGDVLYQFREDVRTGNLPTVSWLVPSAAFSDHPCSPWYGAWYLSETMDILTQNPEVWKKTIFILCYDENDGYFDHIPPFVPPRWDDSTTGKVSAGIDTSAEFVSRAQQDEIRKRENEQGGGLEGPIGLGFRVPLVIASPWSRGGYVCSQVFDHTSIIQLMEKILSHKTGLTIKETNISDWRRTVCGDLTTSFRPYAGGKIPLPTPVERDPFLASISRAQFRPIPDDYKKLSVDEITQTREQPGSVAWLPRQEAGIRNACALPYELAADGILSADKKSFSINFAVKNDLFGQRAAGAPFRVYAPGKVRTAGGAMTVGRAWNYAVIAGDELADTFDLIDFDDGKYHLQASGPNGFYREFRGSTQDPQLGLSLQPVFPGNVKSVNAVLRLMNRHPEHPLTVLIGDLAYGNSRRTVNLAPSATHEIALDLSHSHGWYDLSIHVTDMPDFAQRYAGHIETSRESFSDPAMGKVQI